jgi:hypothetical protein
MQDGAERGHENGEKYVLTFHLPRKFIRAKHTTFSHISLAPRPGIDVLNHIYTSHTPFHPLTPPSPFLPFSPNLLPKKHPRKDAKTKNPKIQRSTSALDGSTRAACSKATRKEQCVELSQP